MCAQCHSPPGTKYASRQQPLAEYAKTSSQCSFFCWLHAKAIHVSAQGMDRLKPGTTANPPYGTQPRDPGTRTQTLKSSFQAGEVTSFAFTEARMLVHLQQCWHRPVLQRGSKRLLWSLSPNPHISHSHTFPYTVKAKCSHAAGRTLAHTAGPAKVTEPPSAATPQEGES